MNKYTYNRVRTPNKNKTNYDKGKLWKTVLKWMVAVFLVTVTAVVQVSFLPRFRFFGTVPDLLLAFLLSIACFKNGRQGIVLGLLGGFLIDALGSVGLSISPLLYVLLLMMFGLSVEENPNNMTTSRYMLVSIIACGVRSVVTVITQIFSGTFSFLGSIIQTMIPEFFGTLIWCMILGGLVHLIVKKWFS